MGGPSTAPSQAVATQQTAAATQAQQQSGQLFNMTSPGLQSAEDFYTKLSSGDPTTIARAIAPASQQISAQADAAKQRIQTEMPRGGEQRLATENADISKASSIGNLTTTAYTGSFPALASLAGTGLGLSANEMANALAGFQGASSTDASVMNAQASSKAASMGLLGSLGAGAAMGAGTAVCFIAEALWGKHNPKTHLVRSWLNREFTKRRVGRVLVAVYRRYGVVVAAAVRRNKTVRAVLEPVFDLALTRALEWRAA